MRREGRCRGALSRGAAHHPLKQLLAACSLFCPPPSPPLTLPQAPRENPRRAAGAPRAIESPGCRARRLVHGGCRTGEDPKAWGMRGALDGRQMPQRSRSAGLWQDSPSPGDMASFCAHGCNLTRGASQPLPACSRRQATGAFRAGSSKAAGGMLLALALALWPPEASLSAAPEACREDGGLAECRPPLSPTGGPGPWVFHLCDEHAPYVY